MQTKYTKILIVEDVTSMAMTYGAFVRDLAIDVDFASDGTSAMRSIKASPPDVLLLDVNLPDMSGLNVLRMIRSAELNTRVIVITADGSIELAVRAMREGAVDFLVKPFSAAQLKTALRHVKDRDLVKRAAEDATNPVSGGVVAKFIGTSPSIRAVCKMVEAAARSTATVFITGESGSGKEVCASALHACSDRADKPFVALNCAAIPRDLLESEIFGHVKGAFTGASSDRLGAALKADGGTLFLDEVGEMDLSFQAKILRFLETRCVQRVGEDQTRPCDVRIICATNRDPLAEVAAGRFREDLYYRLYVLNIGMPALRKRGDDIVALAKHFLRELSRKDGKNISAFSENVEAAFLKYHWPGNIRELKNVVHRLVVLSSGPVINDEFLPNEIKSDRILKLSATEMTQTNSCENGVMNQLERTNHIMPLDSQIDAAIKQAIAICDGSIQKAAIALDVSPSTIYRRTGAKRP